MLVVSSFDFDVLSLYSAAHRCTPGLRSLLRVVDRHRQAVEGGNEMLDLPLRHKSDQDRRRV